jgi:hypothetical protein
VEIDGREILKVKTRKRSSPDRQVSKARLWPVVLWKEEEKQKKN